MPELPEVETVRQVLRTKIIGKTIQKVIVLYDKIIHDISVEDFQKLLTGKTIKEIDRLGKYMYFDFGDFYMISHLRMEGKYFIEDISKPLEKHDHIIFQFTDGTDLRYNDVRKFGVMEIRYPHNLKTTHPLASLGMEATELEGKYLYEKLKGKRLPIKSLLLDQEIVAGIGNIYADEICFAARIHPLEAASNLKLADCKRLAKASQEIMKKSIEAGGTTIRSYTSSLGVTGRFQQDLYVHTLVNKPCSVCQTPIIKIKVGGRGTYYCPKCQKMKAE